MFYPTVRAVPVALAAVATLPDVYAIYVPRQDTTSGDSSTTTSDNDQQTTSTGDSTSTSADDDTSTSTGTRTRTNSATTTGESSTQTTSSDASSSTSDSSSSSTITSTTDSSSSSSTDHSSTSSSTSASASATETSKDSSGSGGLSVGAIVGIAIAGVVVGGLILMMLTAWCRRRHKAAKRPATMVFDPNFFAGSKAQESVPLTSHTTEQGELARYSDKAEAPRTTSSYNDPYTPTPPHPTYASSSAAYSNASLSGPPLQHAEVHAPTPINPAMAAPIAFSRASTPTTLTHDSSPAPHVGSPPFAPRLDSPRFEGLGVLPALQPGSRDSSVGARTSRADMGDMFFTTPPMSPVLGRASAARPLEGDAGAHMGARESEEMSASHEGEASTSSHLPYPGDAPARARS